MGHDAQKQAWQTPELIVLVRGRPEEAVLDGCKIQGADNGAITFDGGCTAIGGCGPCDSLLGS